VTKITIIILFVNIKNKKMRSPDRWDCKNS